MPDQTEMKPRSYDADYLKELHVMLHPVKLFSHTFIPPEKENMSIADIGCGTGKDCLELAEMLPGTTRIYGVDRDPDFLALAKEKTVGNNNISIMAAEAHALPFEDGMLDVVRFERVFQHLLKPEDSMGEAARVLKNDGHIIIVETDWYSLSFGTSDMQAERSIVDDRVRSLNNGSASRRIPALLTDNGLEIVSITNHITSTNSVTTASYVVVLERLIANASDKELYDGFMNRLRAIEAQGAFSFCWTTKVYVARKR
jgi:SAM-dependent methyltransferase